MISVIIVAFNSGDLIESCLRALPAAAAGEPMQVTVVDNASEEDVTRAIKRSGVEARLLRLPVNRGYSGGNNAGIQQIMRRHPSPKAILILNPDVALPPGAVNKLYSVLAETSDCGAVSPWVTRARDNGKSLRLRTLWGLPSHPPMVRSDSPTQVDRLPGCCMLVRSDVFERVGLFDDAYFLYWEEIDLCLRARRVGYRLLIDTDVKVYHGEGDAEFRRHRVYYVWRNQVYFAFKNYGWICGIIFLLRRVCIGNVRNAFTYASRRKPTLILTGLAGLWAGLRGETGRSTSRHAVSAT
jgi:N-acetylglucosaminyl-diphospho-decaprenol L-rhamnosyltransferase